MSEPEYDSTGEPANEAARLDLAAAKRESAERHERDHEDTPPPGSWRAQMRNYEPETTTMFWDGEEWEIPAKMPNDYFDAYNSGNARGMVAAILGPAGLYRLRIPTDIDAETLGDLATDVGEAAGKVWAVPNLSRSARRSRSTTRR